eukprot:365479-Chlamydomonas_euryale.AAC.8
MVIAFVGSHGRAAWTLNATNAGQAWYTAHAFARLCIRQAADSSGSGYEAVRVALTVRCSCTPRVCSGSVWKKLEKY